MPEIHGHRGARALAPENTLPGLARALAIGVDAIEFDVTLTADGGLILAHDLVASAQTILDTAPVSQGDPDFPYVGKRWLALTLPQISTLDAGGRRPAAPFEATFEAVPGAGVPTLDQVCQLISSLGAQSVTLAAEMKTDPRWPDADVRRLTEAALATFAAYRLTSQARILGFDWRVLRAAEAADPAVPRVALVEPATWTPGSAWLAGLGPADYGTPAAAARDIGAAWLSPADTMTSADLLAAAHREGLRTVVWTVNDPARMADLAQLGVDGIVTDRPDLLRHVLARRGDQLPIPHRYRFLANAEGSWSGDRPPSDVGHPACIPAPRGVRRGGSRVAPLVGAPVFRLRDPVHALDYHAYAGQPGGGDHPGRRPRRG
jgi:glycerophosphoryl diester phosphodiesterase